LNYIFFGDKKLPNIGLGSVFGEKIKLGMLYRSDCDLVMVPLMVGSQPYWEVLNTVGRILN